ncbi:hypothetical protein AMECASPLE_034993 [Ameca splendens]|uniref:Uncharacterized protein n=1 Tax=Ameca splendens TaxID=208324 RepID=A0ABV0ZS61_9TELE
MGSPLLQFAWLCRKQVNAIYFESSRKVCTGVEIHGWVPTIFLWRNLVNTSMLTLRPTGVYIQVLTDTQMFYIELHLPLNISCIHKYHALFGKKAVNRNASAGVEASMVLSCILFILLSFLHCFLLLFPFTFCSISLSFVLFVFFLLISVPSVYITTASCGFYCTSIEWMNNLRLKVDVDYESAIKTSL